jgi:ATP-dependent RNA helicase RhlE
VTDHGHSQGSPRHRRRRGAGGAPVARPHRPARAATTPPTRVSAPFDPVPVRFSTLIADPDLVDALDQRGFVETTPIQSAVLPYALAGKDVIGCAETGTGKTAAYVLPILARLLREDKEAGPKASHHATRALILAPTRELATQIDDEIQGFSYHAPIASAAVYGGVPMEPQERSLKAGVDIVVATPGRLLDHMRSGIGDFSKVEIFVLDEADRMMDMGFWPDVRRIAEAMPPTAARQTLLFSATMPNEVMRFADALAPDAMFLLVGSRRGPENITHEARVVPGREKVVFLAKYLRRTLGPTIVFVNTKIGADRLARQLHSMGLHAAAIHADRSQKDRTAAIEAFRAGRTKVLVATDVAARGLDIDDVALIVNYEVPRGLDAYVHRVGRTGRYDAKGHALTLADPSERRDLEQIERVFGLHLLE